MVSDPVYLLGEIVHTLVRSSLCHVKLENVFVGVDGIMMDY